MKFRFVLASAVLALSLFAAGQAKAVSIPAIPTYTINSDLGVVVAGDSGVLVNTFRLADPGRYQDYNFTGTLETNSRITFDFSLSGPPTSYLESAMGSLDSYVLPPTVVASISSDGLNGQVVISNFASAAADFTSFFHSFLAPGRNFVNVTYAVAAIPLPAALPLFGLGLAGLVGMSRRRKAAQKI